MRRKERKKEREKEEEELIGEVHKISNAQRSF
jgi:hypothetical protein